MACKQHLDSRCVCLWCDFHRIPAPLVPEVKGPNQNTSRIQISVEEVLNHIVFIA